MILGTGLKFNVSDGVSFSLVASLAGAKNFFNRIMLSTFVLLLGESFLAWFY
jgi:hypothetical protein